MSNASSSTSEPSCGIAVSEQGTLDAWHSERGIPRKKMNACIQGIVTNLPPTCQAVIALKEMEGFKSSEIAEIWGVNAGVVKARLHRARTMLRHELESRCDPYRDERNELACDPKKCG